MANSPFSPTFFHIIVCLSGVNEDKVKKEDIDRTSFVVQCFGWNHEGKTNKELMIHTSVCCCSDLAEWEEIKVWLAIRSTFAYQSTITQQYSWQEMQTNHIPIFKDNNHEFQLLANQSYFYFCLSCTDMSTWVSSSFSLAN